MRLDWLVLLSLAALVGCSTTAGNATPAGDPEAASAGKDGASKGGSDATDFTLTDTDGNQVSLSQYLGKGPIVLNFWATWCKPCAAEMPHLQRMYAARKSKGLVVLAVSMDGPETESEVAPFVKKKGYTFPVLLDTETRVVSLYNPRRAAPFTILIDRHGKVVKRREGFNPGDEAQLEADVDAAMK